MLSFNEPIRRLSNSMRFEELMLSRKLFIILNPTAGKGSAAGKVDDIRRRLKSSNTEYEMVLTKNPGHAKKLAAEAVDSAIGSDETVIVSAGGDGTANETINGLMENMELRKMNGNPSPLFSILPIGRGNDMAWGIGVATDWKEALDNLASDETRPMDIGRVRGGDFPDGLWFGNGVGVGFDAIVGFEAARMTHIHGSASYTLGALKTIALYPAAPLIELTTDGRTQQIRPALVSVMNGQRMGGSFFMAPDASVGDGHFDWCHTHQGRRFTLLAALAAYSKGTHRERHDTGAGTATTVSIRALAGTLAVHADGETVCEKGQHLDIDMVPGALRLVGSIRN